MSTVSSPTTSCWKLKSLHRGKLHAFWATFYIIPCGRGEGGSSCKLLPCTVREVGHLVHNMINEFTLAGLPEALLHLYSTIKFAVVHV